MFTVVLPKSEGRAWRGILIAIALMTILSSNSFGQQMTAQSSVPLSKMLTPNGTLNIPKSFQGSIDARGYQFAADKNGVPIFKPMSDPNDVNWDPSFTVPGVGGYLYTVAVNGNYLYVGGWFGTVGNVIAHGVAKYNLVSKTWSTFDSAGVGVGGGTVTCFAFNGSDVYVGGQFTTAGTVPVSNIAKWNPTTGWSALGTGLNAYAWAMSFFGGNLYVTGAFTQAGGGTVNYIAKWNGTSWSGLGGGVNSQTYGLAVAGGALYVGGSFTQAGGSVTVNHIAKWDGTTWTALGSGTVGTDGTVVNVVSYGDTALYVGGQFANAGGNPASNVAKYSIAGNSWSALGGGVNNLVYGLFIDGSSLYVSGFFTNAGIVSANYIAKWNINTSSWSNLGTGLNSLCYSVLVTGGKVYTGGNFTTAGTSSAFGVASWDGTNWSSLASSSTGSVGGGVNAIAVRGDSVFVGGGFLSAGSSQAQNIAVWNRATGQWSALDNTSTVKGVSGTVFSILPLSNGDVYIGGSFLNAGSIAANHIVKWNSATGWSTLGSGSNNGVDNSVYGMVQVGTDLYVCGSFLNAGGSSANRVAKWSGTSWSTLGTGLSDVGLAITLAGGKIYVGGKFATAGGNTVNHIAAWDGSTWSGLGSTAGTDNLVGAIAVSGDTALYVGGGFLNAGGSSASHIAKYSIAGNSWFPLSGGVNGAIFSIAVKGDTVLVGGSFTTAGLLTVNNIAVWKISTSAWSGLGSGTDRYVNAIAPGTHYNIYVGGSFSLAGNKPSYAFARYNPNLTPVEEQRPVARTFTLMQNYPNPFNPTTVISFQLPARTFVTLKVYDILGREVAQLISGEMTAGEHAVTFDGSRLASGMYFYRLSSGSNIVTKKMLMVK